MIRPGFLSEGDPVGIVPPASSISYEYIRKSVDLLESWGLEVILSENIRGKYNQFAGTDEERISALQYMLDHDKLKAVFCARGGYGTTRILDKLSFDKFRKHPKWIVGFSDVTALLTILCNLGIESVHGPMPVTFDPENDLGSLKHLKNLLWGTGYTGFEWKTGGIYRPGEAEGILIGGNISLLCSSIGTSSDIDSSNKILFLEDTDEYLYRLDRMIVQLKRSGKLDDLSGLVIGHMTGMKESETPFGSSPDKIIMEHVSGLGFPVSTNAPIGHQYPNYPVPVGRVASMAVGENSTVLSFKK